MKREDHRASLGELRARIQHWRSSRIKQGPMPEELWDGAAALAKRLGVTHVSNALGVGYAALKQRTGSTGGQANVPSKAGGFLELTGSQVLAAATGPVIEFSDRDGARLTITLPAASTLDVPALISALRS